MQPPRNPTLAEQYTILGREGGYVYYDDGRGDVRCVRVDAEGRAVEHPRLYCGVARWGASSAARRIRERPSEDERMARVVQAAVLAERGRKRTG